MFVQGTTYQYKSTGRTTNMYIFDSLWPFVKLFNILGIFPCHKKVTEEGKYLLLPAKGVWHLFKYFVFFLVCNAPHQVLQGYKFIKYGKNGMNSMMKAITNSPTNSLAFYMMYICMVGQHLILMICLWRIRNQVCKIQDFAVNLKFEIEEKRLYLCGRWMIVLLYLTFFIMMGFGRINEDLESEIAIDITLAIFTPFIIFFTDSPGVCFILLMFNVIKFVYKWIKHLRKLVKDGNNSIWQEIQEFSHLWNKIQSIFSFPIFVFVLESIILLILIMYRSISFIIFDVKNVSMCLIFVGYISLGIALAFTLGYLNFYAEMVTNQVQKLKDDLHRLLLSIESTNQSKMAMVSIHQWTGFSGYGFFTLGKSLLSSVATAFMTYLIVLVQFQISYQNCSLRPQ